ncbi:protein kinase domain-containing protein [Polyangium fumosum]|uniref:Serine/threonine-protein kinase PknK n=1 Tax=Polyangium fumosum TaxID=889272 RepID=A0A4V5PQG5_9BACT|nr:protein kinase [Polyangium fumosum]TKD13093.1 serine/threonine-protein kinase PknK [Polyangium fumosum]
MPLSKGSFIAGRFTIEDLAGKGGMGEVYRARDGVTGAEVALKVLNEQTDGFEALERFAREARLLAELDHPGIVSYLAHGQAEDGRAFLAMEWLAGQDLGQRLTRGPLTLRDCLTLAKCAADALAAAHRRGIVHRDIKPTNMFLRDDRLDRVTLLDFGIARQAFATTGITGTGFIMGTPGYMAPEQARGDFDIGPSADVFSLGCVLFECLTGKPPFVARDPIALLAKVLFEDVPAVESIRPDTPPELAALLARMLDKNALARPADAVVLHEELAALVLPPSGDTSSPQASNASIPGAALSGEAMQLLCVVVAVPGDAQALRDAPAHAGTERSPGLARTALRARLIGLGVRVEWLADGSLAVVVPPSQSAIDQATQGARCALVIKEAWPEARVALTTGRGLFKNRLPVGEAIDRAVSLLHARIEKERAAPSPAETMGVLIDELSAKLLESRFSIESTGVRWRLHSERAGGVDASRPLLGKPTPCVGREQELAILGATIDGCIDNAEPRVVVVISPPGVGKSRLKHELLRRLRARSLDLELIEARGTPMSSGSPYGLFVDVLRGLSDMCVGDPMPLQEEKLRARVGRRLPPEDAGRVAEFLAVSCGLTVEEPSAALLAAQSDPKLMSEKIQEAFLRFFRAECAARPCLLVLEDLHWSDPASVRLVDAALGELKELPFCVLAFARPEVTTIFPRLWERRSIQQIRLAALGKKAAERLVAAVLGADVRGSVVARIVEQAAGNALFLEELIRAAAEGKSEEHPDTVLAMLQARLSCLDPAIRRVLCAASVFGQTFWRGGVSALLGEERSAQQTDGWLSEIVQAELVEKQPTSRFAGEVEYRFRHALLRDATYDLLAKDDRTLGHRLALSYLERAGENEPVVLAAHAHRGGDMERATHHYLRAAEQSYQRDDHDGLWSSVERGLACGASGAVRGQLLALKLEVCFWREGWEAQSRLGREALELLPRGSVPWCRVLSFLAHALPNRDMGEEMTVLESAIWGTDPEPGAEASYCQAASMIFHMLTMMGRLERALRVRVRLDAFAPRVPESALYELGYVYNGRSTFEYFLGDDPFLAYADSIRMEAAFAGASARRWQRIGQIVLGIGLSAIGAAEEGEKALREVIRRGLDANDPWSVTLARMYLARLLAEQSKPDQREELITMARQLIELQGTNGVVGPAYGALSRGLLAEGRLAEAWEATENALARMEDFRCWRPEVHRTRIEIRLREGDPEAIRSAAEAGLRCITHLGGCVGHSEIPLRLVIAEALAAAGDMEAARQALKATLWVLERRAAKIEDAAFKARYLAVPEHVRARELGRGWLS